MAKKKNEAPSAPVVSKIPVPVSDSALVIDLPDGQKLVVGKMTHGTVIEVATWRGTGRPDSRTNRMMLGMTNAELEATVAEEFKAAAATEEKSLADLVKDPRVLLKTLVPKIVGGFKWLFDFKDQFGTKEQKQITATTESGDSTGSVSSSDNTSNIVSKVKSRFDVKKFKPAKKAKEATKAASKAEDDIDSEVDEWLNQILNKSSKKSAVVAIPSSEKIDQPLTVQGSSKKPLAKARIAKSSARKPATKKVSASKSSKKSAKTKRSR